MTIQYYTKSVYGKELIYLAEATDRQDWFVISGGKATITRVDMERLSSMTGVTFERVFEPVAA